MRVLLINPPFNYYSKHLLLGEPLSLAYLAAYLKKYGYTVKILDTIALGGVKKQAAEYAYGISPQEVVIKIQDWAPDVVGITCPFSLRNDSVLNIAGLAKTINPKIVTIVGGIHPTIFPVETLKNPSIDYVVIGEGEQSLVSLIKHIESGSQAADINIDGLAYQNKNHIKLNPKLDFIENLDSIPLPARELIPMEFYIRQQTVLYGLGQGRSATVITSRSCPKRCTFCSMYLSHGLKWRARSAQSVVEEIKFLIDEYKVEEIFFMDDNLTFNKDRIFKLCEMILEQNLKFKWNTPNGIAAQGLDVKLASLMKRAGCVNVCIGVETGNEELRNKVIRKGLTQQTIQQALKSCQQAGLPVVGFFILGIPGDKPETFKDTLKMVRENPFSMISTSFFTPFPGTKLYDDCIRHNYIKKDYWQTIKKFNQPMVETPDFDKQTLKKWERKIYYEFFKSHCRELMVSILTLKNCFFKAGLVRRFLKEKFNL